MGKKMQLAPSFNINVQEGFISLWNRVLKELCKYPANISLDQGLKVLVPPPQNLYVCWNDLDEEVFSCVFFCQRTQLTCQMTSLYYLL